MRAIQKLVKNGSATQVTIARPLLIQLGWLSGEPVIVENVENRGVFIRRLDLDELAPRHMARVTLPRRAGEPAPALNERGDALQFNDTHKDPAS